MCALDLTLPAPRAPVRQLGVAGIAGLGAALPDAVVANGAIAERIGVDEAWIERRTGIRSRRHADAGARLADLAASAGARALADAQLTPTALDLVIVATLSQDRTLPNAAPLVAHELGATRAGAFDLGSACTGFIAALAAGGALVEAGPGRRGLLLGGRGPFPPPPPPHQRAAPRFGAR